MNKIIELFKNGKTFTFCKLYNEVVDGQNWVCIDLDTHWPGYDNMSEWVAQKEIKQIFDIILKEFPDIEFDCERYYGEGDSTYFFKGVI